MRNIMHRACAAVQAETSWARPLCTSLQHYVAQLHLGLAHDTQQELGRALLARLLQRIEAIVAAKKFTALGGLLLDRCVGGNRSMISDALRCLKARAACVHACIVRLHAACQAPCAVTLRRREQ